MTALPSSSWALTVAAQGDGRIVASGGSANGAAIARFLPSGALDTSFNGSGTRAESPAGTYGEQATVLALQPDGKIIIGGQYAVDPNPPIGFTSRTGPYLARYNVDGSPDTGFGSSGVVRAFTTYGAGPPLRFALQPDGRIVAITSQFIARHNADGSIDGTFAAKALPEWFRAVDLVLQGDGRLIVIGRQFSSVAGHSDIGFIRYSPDGVQELVALQDMGEFSLEAAAGAIQSDGKVLIAGGSPYESLVLRLLPSGDLDPSFGKTGMLRASESPWGGIALQPDGRILLRSAVEMRRLLPDGSRDATFGIRGDFGAGILGVGTRQLALQADGRILLAGSDGVYPSSYRMMVARVDPAAVPILAVDPPALDFGSRPRNTPGTIALTVTNPQSTPVSITAVTATAPYSVSHDCATLAVGASCKATVTFLPPFSPTGFIDSVVVFATSVGSFEVPARGAGENLLVRHFYLSILRREADTPGRLYWTDIANNFEVLLSGTAEAWYGMAARFYASPEYAAFNRDDTEYMRDLYRTFFDREMEEAGRAYWTGQLAAGLPRDAVLATFMMSAEFEAFVTRVFGQAYRPAHKQTVLDFYRGFMARLPDRDGYNYWTEQFRSALCSGAGAVAPTAEAISSAFLNSGEYAARNRSNAQFVSDLYNAFMRRGGDLEGVRYWTSQLDSGARTRDNVRQQFRGSPEFTARVNAMVAQGCPPQ